MIVNLLLGLNTESTVVWAHNNNNRFVILKDFLKNEEVFSFSVYFFRIQFLVTKSGQNLISVSSSGTRVDKIRSSCPVWEQEWTKFDLRVQFGDKSGQNKAILSTSQKLSQGLSAFTAILPVVQSTHTVFGLHFGLRLMIIFRIFLFDHCIQL